MMRKCYASGLGDCAGPLEREHFVSDAIQRMLGSVDVTGFGWQEGRSQRLAPGSYAYARMICRRHHDSMDGLDGTALGYFRNLLMIASGHHIDTGALGTIGDIESIIDGRGLERWFLKMLCGAIASKAIDGKQVVSREWIEVLFGYTVWPDEWALYVATGKRRVRPEHGVFGVAFHWGTNGNLNGVVASTFSVDTIFSLVPPDGGHQGLLRRPLLLGAAIERPGHQNVLVGAAPDDHIRFILTWPKG